MTNRYYYTLVEVSFDDFSKMLAEFVSLCRRLSSLQVRRRGFPAAGDRYTFVGSNGVRARRPGIVRMTSEVSLTARPFLEKRGYRVVAEQLRRANRLFLKNFRMEKTIP